MAIGEREAKLFLPIETIDICFHRKLRELGIIRAGERLPLMSSPVFHPNSRAKYFLEEYLIGDDLGYAYELDSGGSTSRHYHLVEYNIGEDYYWVEGGEQRLILAGEEHFLNCDNPYIFVPPGVVHQSFVDIDSPPVRTFVRMRNGLLVPKDKRHIRVPETTWEVV